MSDDLLERATRALREDGERVDVERTRGRVMDSLRTAKKKRARLFYAAFPIAAVLIGTTAWAASTGRLMAIWRSPPPEQPAPPPGSIGAPPGPIAPPPPPEAPPPRPEAPPPSVEAPPPPPPKRPVEDASSADLALYQTAHTLHFAAKRYDAALSAWDDYLRGSPNGAFVAEARYNRAICLVKLGRNAEARVALQPFAEGKIASGYRMEEAKKLLERIASE